MRRAPLRFHWLIAGLVVLLALTACERQISREDTPDVAATPEATTAPIVIPTAVATLVPEPDLPTAPETGESTQPGAETDQPSGETGGEPSSGTAGGDAGAPADSGGQATTYTVQSGDTLGQIAERFDVSLEELAAANNIVNIHALDVGQVLTIPAPGSVVVPVEATPAATGERTHVVRAGENLFRIGLAYGFSVEELASYNGIVNPERIEIGQVIRIPPEN